VVDKEAIGRQRLYDIIGIAKACAKNLGYVRSRQDLVAGNRANDIKPTEKRLGTIIVFFWHGSLEFQFKLTVTIEIVTLAVILRYAMFDYRRAMLFCGIALVLAPMISRELFIETAHVFVAIGLGQYGCSSYGLIFGIAMNNAGVGK